MLKTLSWLRAKWQFILRPVENPIVVSDSLMLHTDPSGYIRAIGWVIGVGFLGLMLWASFAPIDKGVPASGTVIAASNKKDIKYLSGGVVDRIFVKEGELVQEGQVLVQINPTQTKSSLNSTKESMAAIVEQRKASENLLNQKRIQLTYIEEQLQSLRQLSKEGFVARTIMLDKDREAAQMLAAIAEDQGNIEKFKRQINEANEKIAGYKYEFSNTLIKAPVDGYVNGLTVFTEGGSIAPGSHLMDIIPKNDDLVIEAQVPINLIDKVKPNLEVNIIFSAFNQNRTPHIPAKVTMVSPDKILDDKTNMPYYKIHASVTDLGKKMLQDLEVRSGMPAEVLIKTGQRTFLNYLIKPFIDRSYSAFKEE
jgi:protease secretion system membrane fusion protein